MSKNKSKKIESVKEAVVVSEEVVSNIVKAGKKDPLYDDVELHNDSPYVFKIGRKEILPGKNIVKRHQVDSIREMMYRKRYADMRVAQGKNYLTEKLAGNVLVIKEVDRN